MCLLEGHEQSKHEGAVEDLVLIGRNVMMGHVQAQHACEDSVDGGRVAPEDRGVQGFERAAPDFHPAQKRIPPDQADLQVWDADSPVGHTLLNAYCFRLRYHRRTSSASPARP